VNAHAAVGSSAPALERLREEQRQITDLFETFARQQRDPAHDAAEAARLADLIVTLLRVHDGLESRLLQPAMAPQAGAEHPVLERATARRKAVRDAADRVETLSPRDPAHGREMAALALHVHAWFDLEEAELFELAGELSRREPGLDLSALDRALAERQEALLSAGPVV
jgi:hypothetical protein